MKKALLIAPVLFLIFFLIASTPSSAYSPLIKSEPLVTSVPCSSIGDNGTIYENTVLTDDLYTGGNCLTIGADNIELDCNGHTLQGPDWWIGTGITVQGKHGVTIKNCNIDNFRSSITVYEDSSSNIISNNIHHSHFFVIDYLSTNNTVIQNTFNDTNVHIGGDYNLIENSQFNLGVGSIWDQAVILSGNYNTFNSNTFTGQGYSWAIYNPMDSTGNIITNNLMQGFITGIQICDTYGEEICGGNVITGNTIINNGIGMAIGEGDLNTISDNYIDSNLPQLYKLRALKGDYSPITLKDGTALTMEWGVELTYSHNNIMWLNNLYDQNNIWDIDNNLYCFDGESNFYNFEIDENCQGDCIIPDCSEILNNNGQWGYSGGKKNLVADAFDNIFTWNHLPVGPGWIDYLYNDAVETDFALSAPQGSDSFAWRIYTLPNKYKVSVWKFDHPYSDYMARSAKYQIYHANGVDTVYVDQSTTGDEWITLGEYTFDNLDPQRGVLLTDDGSNAMIIADAIKIESIGPPEYD